GVVRNGDVGIRGPHVVILDEAPRVILDGGVVQQAEAVGVRRVIVVAEYGVHGGRVGGYQAASVAVFRHVAETQFAPVARGCVGYFVQAGAHVVLELHLVVAVYVHGASVRGP